MRDELFLRAGKVVLHRLVNEYGVSTGKCAGELVMRVEHDRDLAAPAGADDADEGE